MSIGTGSLDAVARCLEPVLGLLTEDQVTKLMEHHGSPQLQQRVSELFQKSNEGELSSAEREEYEGYVWANNYLALLQAKVRKGRRSADS